MKHVKPDAFGDWREILSVFQGKFAPELARLRQRGEPLATVCPRSEISVSPRSFSFALWRMGDEVFQRSMNPGGSSGLVETSSSIEASFEVPMMPL